MKRFLTSAGAVSALAITLGAALPAHADLTQFALTGGVSLTYNATKGTLSTPTGGYSTILTFLPGSTAATLFPNGISVKVTLTATKSGSLETQAPLGGSTKVLEYAQDFTDTDLTITYAGSTDLKVGTVVLATPGATIISATDLSSALTGDAKKPGASGTVSVPVGVTFSFDDTTPTSSGDFVSPDNFFDFQPGGDSVVEDSFTFSDSSKLETLTGSSPSTYKISTLTIQPNGNLSANPVPKISAIPEPATWALMLVGFGGVGAIARRRKMVSGIA